jgi:cysteinyl-tRNA synthetase
VRAGNAALDNGDLDAVATALGSVTAMTEVLGINPLSPEWQSQTSAPAERALATLVEALIEQRNAARAAKDFGTADRIRDELAQSGVTVEDGPTGSHWSLQ